MMMRISTMSGRLKGPWVFILLLLLPLLSEAQISHSVQVSSFVFTPNVLTIDEGDTVVWTNVGGTHNVNGTQSEFPSNPESFGNDLGAGWVYSFVFNLAGEYDYRCDPHWTAGMTGTITVLSVSTGVNQESEDPLFSIYPNPVAGKLHITAGANIRSISIYSATGSRILLDVDVNKANHEISLEGVRAGVYFVEVRFGDQGRQIVRLVKR